MFSVRVLLRFFLRVKKKSTPVPGDFFKKDRTGGEGVGVGVGGGGVSNVILNSRCFCLCIIYFT